MRDSNSGAATGDRFVHKRSGNLQRESRSCLLVDRRLTFSG